MLSPISTKHLCKITLLGNLVKKPEIRYLANPVVALAEVKLATNSRWYDKTNKQYKEWTNFHTIKVIGNTVENTLLQAEKGDVLLVHGHLVNSHKTKREVIHANFTQIFSKGYAQSMNLIQVSGELSSDVKLMTTEQNKLFAEASITINHKVLSATTNKFETKTVTRPFHLWGKQAQYLKDHAEIGCNIIIDGQLNYLKDKNQYIEVKQLVTLKA